MTTSLPSNGVPGEVLPTTFEDALAFENVKFFTQLRGVGLTKKFSATIASGADLNAVACELHNHLQAGSKAELALDIMVDPEFGKLIPPQYIEEGLAWLAARLEKPGALTLEDAQHGE